MAKWNPTHDKRVEEFKELCRSMEFDVEEVNKVYQLRASYFETDVLDYYPKSGKVFDLQTKQWKQKYHSIKDMEEIFTLYIFENN